MSLIAIAVFLATVCGCTEPEELTEPEAPPAGDEWYFEKDFFLSELQYHAPYSDALLVDVTHAEDCGVPVNLDCEAKSAARVSFEVRETWSADFEVGSGYTALSSRGWQLDSMSDAVTGWLFLTRVGEVACSGCDCASPLRVRAFLAEPKPPLQLSDDYSREEAREVVSELQPPEDVRTWTAAEMFCPFVVDYEDEPLCDVPDGGWPANAADAGCELP